MARVHKVERCRKEQKCGKCGGQVKPGEAYLYWAFMVGGRGGPKHVRCSKPECAPKPSDLTQSEYLQAVYGLAERKPFDGVGIDDLEAAVSEVVEELTNLADETQEKFDNLPEGLQGGDTGQLLEERVSSLQDAAADLEGVDLSFDPGVTDEGTEEYEQAKEERELEVQAELQGVLEAIS